MSTKRLLAFTGIRSDYDLLSGLYKKMSASDLFELELIVYGAHLSKKFGYSFKEIELDGIKVNSRIENLIDSDSRESRIKSAASLIPSVVHDILKFNPDALLYAGDREDALMAAIISAYLAIPGIHFFGGDHCDDRNVDNSVRHAISKLSSYHVVSTPLHKQRLESLGEESTSILLAGSPSLDKFLNIPRIHKPSVMRAIGCEAPDKYAVLIHHPIIVNDHAAASEMELILNSLIESNIFTLIGYPNIDSGNEEILGVIRKFEQHSNIFTFGNINRDLFVNLLRDAEFLIGNSSAGIIEAPIIPIPAINVGLRQRGREHAKNVIFANACKTEIMGAIELATSGTFRETLKSIVSPYGDGRAENRILDVLINLDLDSLRFKNADPLSKSRRDF